MWIKECGHEHADRSGPMGWRDKKGNRGVIIRFVISLQSTYLYGQGIVQMEACRWKHVDLCVCVNRSMWIVACKWEHGDGSMVT